MTRVGFAPHLGGEAWLGGTSYFRNLFSALGALEGGAIEPVLLIRAGDEKRAAELGPRVTTARIPDFLDRASSLTAKALARLGPLWWLAWRRFLVGQGIEAISHSPSLLPARLLPSLGIIYDFQHRHLPDMFAERDYRARERVFRSICRRHSLVLVSSESALSDLRRFLPRHAHKGRVLHFVADLSGKAVSPPEALKRRYDLPDAYVYLPNQFWKHKNHATVVHALDVLRRQGREIVVAASGTNADYRHPEHFGALLATVEGLGLGRLFRWLGVLPYEDVLGLMRASAAVLNPSFFEGWSTTVEEAKSMGKTVLLSDIPVHREQKPERGLYFRADSPQALAECLAAALDAYSPEQDARAMEKARAEMPARVRGYARRYQELVFEALGHAAETATSRQERR